ncbi:hypothetical protein DL765_010780 [Monosporascus sp. GIB2]|nr:hypothetical protein DL765_010780 [Monosporascus sp. GIB2]
MSTPSRGISILIFAPTSVTCLAHLARDLWSFNVLMPLHGQANRVSPYTGEEILTGESATTKLLYFLHAVLLATVVGALPAVLTKRDEELDRYQREQLHHQIPHYVICNEVEGASGRAAMYSHSRSGRHSIVYPGEIEPFRRGVGRCPPADMDIETHIRTTLEWTGCKPTSSPRTASGLPGTGWQAVSIPESI